MVWLIRVRSHSMAPTLRDGQLALTRSLRPDTVLRRGDLVVLRAREVPGSLVVKRLVGLPGERVSFAAGRVSIDGTPLIEPYAAPSLFRGTYDIPPGHVFVLGDNRDASSDSRTWPEPYIPRADVVGRLIRGPGSRKSPGLTRLPDFRIGGRPVPGRRRN